MKKQVSHTIPALMALFLIMNSLMLGPAGAQEARRSNPETPSTNVDDAIAWESDGDSLVGKFVVDPKAAKWSMPRLYNSLGETVLITGTSRIPITVQPELDHWILSWKADSIDWKEATIRLPLNGSVQKLPKRLTPLVDGSYRLEANQVQTSGTKLRFEPQSFKNTVGYWVDPSDFAWWDLDFPKVGKYNLEILQGCGAGQGGSLVEVRFIELLAKSNSAVESSDASSEQNGRLIAAREFEVEETGHFQNFRWRHLGEVELVADSGIRLEVRVKKIAKNAVMDIRQIMLVRLP